MKLNHSELNTTIHLINLLIQCQQIEHIMIQENNFQIFYYADDSRHTLLGIEYEDLTCGEEPEHNFILIQVSEPYDVIPFCIKDIDSIVIKLKDGKIL